MAKQSNTYSKPEKAEKKSKGKKAKPKSNTKVNFLKPLIDLFSKDRKKLRLSVGAILILLAIYKTFAFLSYLFTWQTDQDKVINQGFFSFIGSNEPINIDNHLGKLGAWVSHQFVYDWFGISAFIVPFVFFLFGLFLMTKYALLPLKRTLSISVVSLVVFSLVFGFFTQPDSFPYGGSLGYEFNQWFKTTVGSIGTALFLIVLVFISVVVLFNPDFEKLLDFFNLTKSDDDFDAANAPKENVNSVEDLVTINSIKDEDIKADNISQPLDFSEPEPEPETPTAPVVEEPEHSLNIEVEIPETTVETPIVDNLPTNELEVTPTPVESTAPVDLETNDKDFQIEVKAEEKVLDENDLDDRVKEFGEYDPKLDLSAYQLPTIELMKDYGGAQLSIDKAELEQNKNKIVEVLGHYKIEISKIKATVGPTVTLYEIVPAPGIRISKIKNLSDDIALSLAALGIRIIAPIPGKGTIGIEVPNSKPDMVAMRTLIASEKFQNSDMELPVVIGKTISNETFIFDLAKAPHLLVAGATGQGKSVGLNAILVSILYKKHPAQVKFVMVDPKKVELTLYNKIERHFLAKLPDAEEAIITDTTKVVNTMNSLCIEMDERYELLKNAQVRNIKEYNAKFISRRLNPENGHRYLPYIVVVIDEFADLIMTAGKEIEHPIARLAQLARAIGIHLIVATQRPSVNVITGMIKANFPARIAFKVSSGIDSKTILDATGADQLIGRGDMLISFGNDITRLQCAFVDTPEVESICDFIGDQRAYPSALMLPEYVGENEDGGKKDLDLDNRDALFEEAAQILVTHQQGSASLLQRKLKIGYNRAGRIIDQMEGYGIIGPFKGSKAREVLIPDLVALEQFLKNLDQ